MALVIGNSTYKAVPALTNPRNDAADIATALRSLDFEVIERYDVDKNGIRPLLKDFSRKVADADTALVYYAGHALQYRGQLYLMPVDAQLEDATALKFDMLAASDIRDVLDRVNGVRIMIFDACRNDPFKDEPEATPTAPPQPQGPTRGLTRVIRPQGSVIAYATAPLDVAEDGTKRNSPFTRSLLKWIKEPGLEINQLFQRVRNDVYEITGKRQLPEITVSLLHEFYLNRAETDYSSWARIRFSSDPADFRDFLSRFPASEFAPDARYRLDAIERGRKLLEERQKAIKLKAQQQHEQEMQRRVDAACRADQAAIDGFLVRDGRAELERLRTAATLCPETPKRIDVALGEIDRHGQERAEACRREASEIGDLASQGRGADLAELRKGVRCPDSAARIEQALLDVQRRQDACRQEVQLAQEFSTAGKRDSLLALRGRPLCQENVAAIDAALGRLSEREAAELQGRLDAACQREASLIALLPGPEHRNELLQLKSSAQCPMTPAKVDVALAGIERACGGEAAEAATLIAKADKPGLAALTARARCPETAVRVTSGLAQIAALEEQDRQQRQAEQEQIKYKQRCIEEEKRARVLYSTDQRSDLEALGRNAQCAETKPRVEAALQQLDANRRAKACERETAELAGVSPTSLDPRDVAKVEAMAGRATCAETAVAARDLTEKLRKLQSAEQACQTEAVELDRLKRLGGAGREAFNRYLASLSCDRLKSTSPLPPPLAQASLAQPAIDTPPPPQASLAQPPIETSPEPPPPAQAMLAQPPVQVPLVPPPIPLSPAPAVDTPELVAKAATELQRIACLGRTNEASLAQVRKALETYYGWKGETASPTIDQTVISRLEQERRPVCRVQCAPGEHERRGKCVADALTKPKPRQQRENRPTQAERPSAPSRPPVADKPKNSGVICTGC
ncbi:MAG: caspase family protein [Ancalomicrobiaceae bacterium]|nr:caspase family protein [Ancalomicrobiaceae bacterium]